MQIMQEPKKVALWNKRNFEEKKTRVCAARLKYSVRIFVEKIYKMGCLEGFFLLFVLEHAPLVLHAELQFIYMYTLY
jgi:hypothetical protein